MPKIKMHFCVSCNKEIPIANFTFYKTRLGTKNPYNECKYHKNKKARERNAKHGRGDVSKIIEDDKVIAKAISMRWG